jgi:ABC-type glutathione transport system ATPase component
LYIGGAVGIKFDRSSERPVGEKMDSLLQVRDLRVRFLPAGASDQPAVQGVTFEIFPGETLGLMGESGSGKTTIAMALLGLLPRRGCVVSGSVHFLGQELLSMEEHLLRRIRGARISLVFQEPEISLSPVIRVGEQIAEVIHAHRDWTWKHCKEEAKSALARLGLADPDRIYQSYPHQLSGGQRQRIVLAQALVCGPTLLIADEPTASLDARARSELLRLLRQAKTQARTSMLLISHDPGIQTSLADRLIVISKGEIVEEGPFASLYSNPVHPYTRAMLRRDSPVLELGIGADLMEGKLSEF